MRELRTAIDSAGPFSTGPTARDVLSQDQPHTPARSGIGHRVLLWSRHGLTLIGGLTVFAFVAGATPIPEMIGDVTGRIGAAATDAQAESQGRLAEEMAEGQQGPRVNAEQELQEWQAALQADLAALSAALDGTKSILIQRVSADLQARNMLLQTNAQLQADRVRQIMQIQEMLERGNIASAQALDMIRNLSEALGNDAAALRQQSNALKIEVLDQTTRVTPISPDNGSGITAPLEAGGVLDADVQGELANLQAQIARMQQRFAIRSPAPSREPRP